jgi:hypothetical protein
VRYELGFYIPEDGILHSHRRENLRFYIALTGWTQEQTRNVSPVRYEMGFYIPEDGILHSHRRENLKSYFFSSHNYASLPFLFYLSHSVTPSFLTHHALPILSAVRTR